MAHVLTLQFLNPSYSRRTVQQDANLSSKCHRTIVRSTRDPRFSTEWNEWALLFIVLQLSCVPPSVRIFNSTSGPMLESLGDRGCAENPKHYSFMAVMSLIATTMLVQVSHLIKLGLMVLVVTATGAVNTYSWLDLYDLYDYMRFASYRWERTTYWYTSFLSYSWCFCFRQDLLFVIPLCVFRTSIVPSRYLMTMMIIVMMIGFYFFARHVSVTFT